MFLFIFHFSIAAQLSESEPNDKPHQGFRSGEQHEGKIFFIMKHRPDASSNNYVSVLETITYFILTELKQLERSALQKHGSYSLLGRIIKEIIKISKRQNPFPSHNTVPFAKYGNELT